jgi:hypothetical protein
MAKYKKTGSQTRSRRRTKKTVQKHVYSLAEQFARQGVAENFRMPLRLNAMRSLAGNGMNAWKILISHCTVTVIISPAVWSVAVEVSISVSPVWRFPMNQRSSLAMSD